MPSRFGRYALLTLLLLLIGSSMSLLPIFAQDNDIILTIGVDQWQADYFDEELFAAFEEAHPGVKVLVVALNDETRWFSTPTDADGVADFMESLNTYASEADLLPVWTPGTSPLYTRAGAYLDITPLLNADAAAEIEDFYPVMLESMQWDGGTWGLPIAGSLNLIAYNKTAFDEAGLAYPDENWTMQDWMNAARTLTIYDDEGNVEVPGYSLDERTLLAAEYGRSVIDPTAFPSQPLLTDPELISLVETWAAFTKETQPTDWSAVRWEEIPITYGGVWYLDPNMVMGAEDAEWGLAFFPNNKSSISVQGFAISSGTENPQLAYELLQYMTRSPEIGAFFFGDVTARQSLTGVEAEDSMFIRPDLTEEALEIIQTGIENAIPAAELEAFGYVSQAIWSMNDPEAETEMTAEEALLKIQEDTIEVLAAIDEAAVDNVVTVATAVPTPVLSSGEVALNFGVESWYGPGSGDELWDAAIAEFVAQDPEVRHIELDGEFLSLEQRAAEQDCYYLGYNPVPSNDLANFLSLDPYLQADPNYDPNDMVVGTVDQVSRDGMIWGYPMSITPIAIWYDPTAFEEAGLAEPTNDWTISEWEDSMRQLYNGEDPVFQTQNWGGNYILMLAAAYGGIPIDYSTQPATLVIDETAINAVREVLDMAKEGLIDYQALASNSGGMYMNEVTMFDSVLYPNDWRLQNRGEEFGSPHRVVMFPSGTEYTPVSYTLAAAFISPQSPAADACYRWLSFLSQRPELLNGMPVRRSSFDTALQFITDGDDVVQFYNDFDAVLSSDNALVLPQAYGDSSDNVAVSMQNYLTTWWMYKAFDNYVLEDGDIESDLVAAQAFQADFLTCISGFEEMSYADFGEERQEEFEDYYFQFVECAVAVDPDLREQFQYFYDQRAEEE